MRFASALLLLPILLLAFTPAHSVCQEPRWARGWGLTLGGDAVRFGSVAEQAGAPAESAVSLRPSARAGLRAAVTRAFAGWRAQLEAEWAEGDTQGENGVIVVRDQALDLSRYRVALAAERRVAGVGAGELSAALGPTLDLWRVSGNSRVLWGIEGRLALRVPLGEVALENRLAVGFSGSPLGAEDLGEDLEGKALRWLAFGVGLWIPL